MPIETLMNGGLSPPLAHEAMRLFQQILHNLHVVTTNPAGEVLFVLQATPQLADDLSAFGACREDDEDDGAREYEKRSVRTFIGLLRAPAPRQGWPVPPWHGPSRRSTMVATGTDLLTV